MGVGSPGGLGGLAKSAAQQSESKQVGNSITVTNSQTLYRRGNMMVTPDTASLDLEKDSDKITKLKRFSSEYFDLVSKNSASDNQLLGQQATGESLLVKIRGVVYLIE